jgi:hypothetical protein
MALSKAKLELVTQKNNHGLLCEINKTDVMKLAKQAWAVSFAREDTSQKAML